MSTTEKRRRARLAIILCIAVSAGWVASIATGKFIRSLPPVISGTDFFSEVDHGHVARVVIRDRELISGTSSTRGAFRVTMPVNDATVNELRSRGVVVEFETSSDLIP
jgi:hypothetical protein